MLLYDVFITLQLHRPYALLKAGTRNHLLHLNVTQADLNHALKNKTSSYRRFFFEAPQHKVQPLQLAYDDFLTHCQHALNTQQTVHIFPLVMDFLNKGRYINQALQLLDFQPNTPEEALRITPLAIHCIDDPAAFASFLGWLTMHQVTADAILKTHVVQDYFRYHVVDALDTSISNLYTLLHAETETCELANALSQTRCPENELSSYALDGSIRNPEALNNPERLFPFCTAPLTEIQFQALQSLFGVVFLQFALAYLPKNTAFLAQTLNADASELRYLPELLHAIQSNEQHKQILAQHLSEEALNSMIDARLGSVLGLLPYSAYLRNKISESDLSTYLQAIIQNAPSRFDLINHLSELLNLFKHQHEQNAQCVFTTLLHEILADPSFLDDESLLKQLRKFRPGEPILSQILTTLEVNFKQFIQNQIITSEFDYIAIEDEWRRAFLQIKAIERIHFCSHHFPKDKHELQILLAKTAFKQHAFELDTFARTLGLEPVFHATDVSPYERFLINMLIALDDETLRVEIIQQLDQHLNHTKNWRTALYADKPLVIHASQAGNLGLITWLESAHIKFQNIVGSLVITAAGHQHWHLVKHFLTTYPLKQIVIDGLLHHAIQLDAPHAIHFLCENPQHPTPSRRAIENAFTQAVLQEKLKCVHALLGCSTPPCDAILTKGFRQAIQMKQFILASQIAENRPVPHLQDAINQMLLDAARLNKIGMIHFLGGLSKNPITQGTLDYALKYAVRAGNPSATAALYRLPYLTPRAEAQKQSMKTASKKRDFMLLELLSKLPKTSRSEKIAKRQDTSCPSSPNLHATLHRTSIHQTNMTTSKSFASGLSFFSASSAKHPAHPPKNHLLL